MRCVSNIHTKPKMKQSQYVIFAVQMPFVFYLYGIWLEHRRLPRAHWQHCAEELRPGPRQPPEDVLGSKQHRARSLSPWAALICSPRLCFFGLRAMFSIEGEEAFKTRSEPRPRTGRLGAGAGPGPLTSGGRAPRRGAAPGRAGRRARGGGMRSAGGLSPRSAMPSMCAAAALRQPGARSRRHAAMGQRGRGPSAPLPLLPGAAGSRTPPGSGR